MVPSLTCGGPVLLGQGVREVFDPQVVIVTWWVGRDSKETGQVKPPGVVTRPEGESGGETNLYLEQLYRPPASTSRGGGGGKKQGTPTSLGGGGKRPRGVCFLHRLMSESVSVLKLRDRNQLAQKSQQLSTDRSFSK